MNQQILTPANNSGNSINPRAVLKAIAAIALFIAVFIGLGIAVFHLSAPSQKPQKATASVINPDFSTFCVYDDKAAAFVIAYPGEFGTASSVSSNLVTHAWVEKGNLSLKTPGGITNVTFNRIDATPEKLTLAGTDYNLTQGRVFLLDAKGVVRQLSFDVAPIIKNAEAAAEFKKQITASQP